MQIVQSTDVHAALRYRKRTVGYPRAACREHAARLEARARENLERRKRDIEQRDTLGILGGCAAAAKSASASASAWTPLNITSVPVLLWLRADLGVTHSGGTVSQWLDQGPNGYVFIQAAPGSQPAYSASGGINGTPVLLADGVDDVMTSNWNPLAPSVQNLYFWLIAHNVAHATTTYLFAGSTSATLALTKIAGGLLRLSNGVNVSGPSMPTGATSRVASLLTGGGTDSIKVRGTTATGAFGNNDSTNFSLFGRSSTGFSATGILELLVTAGAPTEPELEGSYGPGLYTSVPFT